MGMTELEQAVERIGEWIKSDRGDVVLSSWNEPLCFWAYTRGIDGEDCKTLSSALISLAEKLKGDAK